MNLTIEKLQQAQLRKDLPAFRAGDTVRVHVRLKEGDEEKERIQPFEGVVIKKRGVHTGSSFTVRRVSFGIGIERIFPAHSPAISAIEVHRARRSRSRREAREGRGGVVARARRAKCAWRVLSGEWRAFAPTIRQIRQLLRSFRTTHERPSPQAVAPC
jgi:large subunit ribosomal protein L19